MLLTMAPQKRMASIHTLGLCILFGLALCCVPGLPPGTKTCQADTDCNGGQVCAVKVCRASCDPTQTKSCPSEETCAPLGNGKSACVPTSVAPPPTGTGKEGEACSKTGCTTGLICAQAPHESDFFCRTRCSADNGQCPQGHFCGTIGGTSDAACFPKAPGSVDEFGKCAGTYGECKNNELNLVCVINPQHEPAFGFCLRACNKDGSCRQGYHCIKSVTACGEACEIDKKACSYGACNQTSSMPNEPVCF